MDGTDNIVQEFFEGDGHTNTFKLAWPVNKVIVVREDIGYYKAYREVVKEDIPFHETLFLFDGISQPLDYELIDNITIKLVMCPSRYSRIVVCHSYSS